MKKLIAILTVALISGCAGLSPAHKDEKQALKAYQQAEAKVQRKVVKLSAATAASALAIKNIGTSQKELKQARIAKDEAYQKLLETIGATE